MSEETENSGLEIDSSVLLIPQPRVDRDLIEPSAQAGQTEYFKPIGARVLIEPYTISSINSFEGIIIPQQQDKPTNIGIVREVGTAFLDTRVTDFYPFGVGSTIVFNPTGSIEIIRDMKKLFIVDCEQIIAIKEIRDIPVLFPGNQPVPIVHDANSIPADTGDNA